MSTPGTTSTAATQVQLYAACIFAPADVVEIRLLPSGKSTWYAAAALPAFADTFARHNGHGEHIFIGANPRRQQDARGDANVELARCLFADFDTATIEDATAAMEAAHLPPPTLMLNSGHGVHAYWRMEEPCHDLGIWREYQKRLIAAVGSDQAIHNPERLMRLPGFINVKPPQAPCAIVEAEPTRVYAWADVLGVLPPAKVNGDGKIHEGKRNAFLTSQAGSMRRRGMSEAAILAALLAENSARCSPPLERSEVERIARSVGKYPPEAEPGETPLKPSYVSAGTLIDQNPHLREPLIDGLNRQRETMGIVSASKRGKTYLIIALMLSIASGRALFGVFPVRRGRVLMFDNELHPETLARRIDEVAKAMGILRHEYENNLQIECLRGRVRDLFAMRPYFDAIPAGEFAAISIDAWYRMIPPKESENDNAIVTRMLNAVDMHAERIGASFFIIHHASKGNQSDKSVTDMGSGAGAQSRAVDTHLVLRQHEEEEAVVMEAAVRSFKPVAPICLRWKYPLWVHAPELNPEDLKKPGSRRRVKAESEPAAPTEPEWTVGRFVQTFITDEPQDKKIITASATIAGVSSRMIETFITMALKDGKAHRWIKPKDRAIYLANRHQTVTEIT